MAFNGSSVGGAIFTPLWALLITDLGFIPASIAIGVVMVVALWWVAGRYLRPTPSRLGLAVDGDVAPETEPAAAYSAPASDPLPLRPGIAAWRERRFATLSLAFALGLFAQIGLLTHLFSLLVPALGTAGAGLSISFVTGYAVLGRTLLGTLLPANVDRRVVGAPISLCRSPGACRCYWPTDHRFYCCLSVAPYLALAWATWSPCRH